MEVTAWTKTGDKVAAPGKWSVVRLMPHRGFGCPVPIPKVDSYDNPDRALKVYREKSATHRKGGVFLVDPEGVVAACLWISP